MLHLSHVSKHYADTTALHETTLEIVAGATTVLIGPSGCGKSTVLRLMAGLITPDTGEVLFDGVPLSPTSLPQLRRRMGFMIQDGGLFPHLTGAGNVRLMPKHLRWPEPEIADRLATLVELTRLPAGVLDRFPGEMSGGQRQRVSLIRSLMLDPSVLLLDEPLGALDPLIRFDLQNDLQEIFRRLGKTVVMVTHDLSEAAFFAGEIVLMREGRIVQRGTVDDLLNRPVDAFVERFVRAQRRTIGGEVV